MVEIPEHLLKRSREAMARAKAAKGESVEPVEEESPEAQEAASSEPPAAAEARPDSAEAPAPEPSAASPATTLETALQAAPKPEPGVAVSGQVDEAGSPFPSADLAAAGGYSPEELVESAAGIKEVASSRAPGWLVLAFVIIPIVSILYLTQFSHGVQCGQAGTLKVGGNGQLQTCDGKPLPSPGAGGTKKQGPDGAQIFAQRCAACHGPNGEGGVGRPLNKNNGTTLLEDFPTAAAQIEFVTKGNQAFPQGWGANARPPRGVMPAFGNTLSPDEIQAVVQFERSLAGEAAAAASSS
ncbi:MAG: hypothetical protein C4318_00215 [Acidimicrobiia bacterium]